jgi:predicted ATP-grasp superfamily ATP-dependent carboligase
MQRKPTVLLTTGYTEGGLAAAKAFKAKGYSVGTTIRQRLPLGLRSRYIDADYVVSEMIGETNQAEFETSLLEMLNHVRPDLFLPLTSRATFVASKYRDRLSSLTALNVPTLEAFLAAYNKDLCMTECRDLGIPCPAQYSYEQAIDVLERDPDAVLVVKPDCDAGGSKGVKYVRTREQLTEAVRECTTYFGGALLQEYVPGGVDAMKTVVVVFSRNSRLVSAFTTQKMRQWPVTGGSTVASRSTADEALVKQVLPFFEKWNWCGPAEVELKTDSRTGQHKVMEINPRFPGYLRFLLECGLDLPTMVTSDQRRGAAAIPFIPDSLGAEYREPVLTLKVLLAGLRSGSRKKGEFRANLTQMRKALPIALRMLMDPLPLVGKAMRPLWFGRDRPSLTIFVDKPASTAASNGFSR